MNVIILQYCSIHTNLLFIEYISSDRGVIYTQLQCTEWVLITDIAAGV